MQEAIAALERWLVNNAPPLLDLLNPPATLASIADFEARQILALPPDVRSLYLLHDGEADGSDGIFGCWRWLPLELVGVEIELIGSKGIVPLFRSGGGDLYYVKSYDAAAPDRRLYEWWHEVPEEAAVVSENVEQFIVRFVAELRTGRYVYRPRKLAALIDRREL